MIWYIASFILGMFVAQEYNVPNVKIIVSDTLRRLNNTI